MEDLAVARVGRLTAEDELRDRAAADLLVQVRVLEEAAARAAGLRRQVRGPEPRLPGLLLQLGDQRVRSLVLAAEGLLVRIDVVLHERANALTTLDDPVRDDSSRHRQQ